jgi:hypothetical protein
MHRIKWILCENIYVVPTASAICEVKPEYSGFKPDRNPWRICQILIDKDGDPGRRNVLTGLANRTGQAFHMGRFLYILYLLLLSISKILASSQPTL